MKVRALKVPPNHNIRAALGRTVRRWRKSLKLSQGDLALRSGLHRTYISEVEHGYRNISLEGIHKIARALQTTEALLLTFEPNEQEDVHNGAL